MAALVLAAAVSGPASADIPQGATFLDGSDLDLALTSGDTFTINLDVINGSVASARFTLSILDLQSSVSGAVPFAPAPTAAGAIATSASIAAGEVWKQAVTIAVNAPPGVYSGEFVVTGSDGTLDQRGFHLTVSPSPGSFGGALSQGLNEPMPDITLSVERSSLIFNESKPAPDVFFPVDPALAPGVLPGQLINESGERADLSIGTNGYVTITAHGPGAYKGVLARAPRGLETNPVALAAINLDVRDDWWAALVVLILALAAGMGLEWFATDAVPKASLRVRLAQLRNVAEKATTGHEAWMESFRNWPGQPGSPRITGDSGVGHDVEGVVTEISPYLIDASKRALKDFDALGSLESRSKRWGAEGEEFTKLTDAEQTFESLLRARRDLALAWLAFVAEMAETQKTRDGRPTLDELAQRSDTRRAVREALGADIIATAAELEGCKKLVDDTMTTVGTLRDLAGSLSTIDYWMPDTSAHAASLDTLWTQLAAMPNPATDIEILRKAAKELLDMIILERRRPRPAATAASTEDATGQAFEIAGRRPTPAPTSVAATTETPGDARLNQLWINVRYGALIGAVALVAGLATQYYSNATFGSISDYVGLLTWGFSGAAAGGLIKNLGGIASIVRRAR